VEQTGKHINTLIVGVGLIGGSFALSLRRCGYTGRILGVEASEENGRRAVELGLVDAVVGLEEGIKGADLVVLTTPVDTLPELAVRVLDMVGDGQVVIDAGSTKEALCESIEGHPRRGRFVATHPMWGTEYSGPDAAQREAFAGRNVVICEGERSDEDALALVEEIYTEFGMPIVRMEAEEHDLHTAYVSHISHITSFALALTVLEKEREDQHIFDLAGGGFESTVRLAKSSARTWVPILMGNKYNVLDVLREHIHQLQVLRKQIERDDIEGLVDSIHKANSIQRIIK
jgi:prephenate dehydrogenase